jgi:large subunit ribosomal protein L3
MTLGLVGRKLGMTRIFTDDGKAVPVTVLDVANNRVTQIKTPEADGYAAVQVTFGKRRASRVTKVTSVAAPSNPAPAMQAAITIGRQ